MAVPCPPCDGSPVGGSPVGTEPYAPNIVRVTPSLQHDSATIPLFVRAGSILPLGVPVESTSQSQRLERVRVYPGADADFTLYSDDGKSYAYEQGESRITRLHWDNRAQKLSHTGAAAWEGRDADLIEVVNPK